MDDGYSSLKRDREDNNEVAEYGTPDDSHNSNISENTSDNNVFTLPQHYQEPQQQQLNSNQESNAAKTLEASTATSQNNLNEEMTSRSLYFGNIPHQTTLVHFLNHVLPRGGLIESVRSLVSEKGILFIDFVDVHSAVTVYNKCKIRTPQISNKAIGANPSTKKKQKRERDAFNDSGDEGNCEDSQSDDIFTDVRVGWARSPGKENPAILTLVQLSATRVVFIGNAIGMSQEEIKKEVQEYGELESIRIMDDKIAFVHFLSISSAILALSMMNSKPEWKSRKVAFGKDRSLTGSAAQSPITIPLLLPDLSPPVYRTIYLGNLDAEQTTIEELCNHLRGGLLWDIHLSSSNASSRPLPSSMFSTKKAASSVNAFVSFVEPTAAYICYNLLQENPLLLHNRKIKVGWAKPSTIPSTVLYGTNECGVTRNLYIGSLSKKFLESPQSLKRLLEGAFGSIELFSVNVDRSFAFASFTNMVNTLRAHEGLKSHPDFKGSKLGFGKDRVANLPQQHLIPVPAAALMIPTTAAAATIPISTFSNEINPHC